MTERRYAASEGARDRGVHVSLLRRWPGQFEAEGNSDSHGLENAETTPAGGGQTAADETENSIVAVLYAAMTLMRVV